MIHRARTYSVKEVTPEKLAASLNEMTWCQRPAERR